MNFIKIKKNRAYHSRFQVKWRRRREGKTDYYARKRLIFQDKRKYLQPKMRLVVRISKKFITCQYVSSLLYGDITQQGFCSRNFLKKYESSTGHGISAKNFPLAYVTGNILAKKFTLWGLRVFNSNANLDIGLSRSTVGHKVFAVMQGAIDGGINIPHNEKNFPGYNANDGFSNETLEQKIGGQHILDYRLLLAEGDEEAFNKQFNPSQ